MKGVVFRICRFPHSHWHDHLLGILQGFGEILDGIVTVGSLGFFMSNFELQISLYRAKTNLQRRIREAKKCLSETGK